MQNIGQRRKIMSERLYRGWSICTPRLNRPRWRHEAVQVECWITQSTTEFIEEKGTLAFLRALQKPNRYPDLDIAFKPHFFDGTEHWHLFLNYHVTDEKLLQKIDAGETICEVCKAADAVLIDGITDLDTNVRNELAMCIGCFDKFADMSRAD